MFLEVLFIVIGVLLVVKGLTELVAGLQSKHTLSIVAACLTSIVGILLILNKWIVVDWFIIVIGVVLIVKGVAELISRK